MDNFIRLYNIYKSSTRWNIIKQIYRQATTLSKAMLWICKIAFMLFLFASVFVGHAIFFWLMTATAITYFVIFYYARKSSFFPLSATYPERLKLFSRNYQYVRYKKFKEECQREGFVGDVEEALRFANYELDFEKPASVSSQPIFAIQIAVILAILGGAAGQWNTLLTVKVIVLLVLSAYVTFMILDAFKSSQPGMNEFKKFLLWTQEDFK